MKRLPFALALASALTLLVGCAAWRSTMARFGVQDYERLDLGPAPIRALWVTRWDYRSERDVRRIIFDAAEMGATDVFWQVRGQADAFYDSDLEPWGEELLADLPPGVRAPTYDPLKVACTLAHAKGLRLHAWFNVMPLWKNRTPPQDRSHLFYSRSDWRLYDAEGRPQPLNDHYVTVNPIFDDVQAHIVRVARDIVRRYPVDGLHLDYIRFVSESAGGDRYPHDQRSYAAFRKATGMDGEESQTAYRLFIRKRISDLVVGIRRTIKAHRPEIIYSAAVWRDPDVGKRTYLQDYETWLKNGWIDLAAPMMYTDDQALFDRELARVLEVQGEAAMIIGIGAYKHDTPGELEGQMRAVRASGADGVSLFAYESFFDSANPDQDKSAEAERLRAMRLEVVKRSWGQAR
jgi:uncharacterized lipoprotein YddW (UPF0748 family)